MRVPYTGKPVDRLKALIEQEQVVGITADAIAVKINMARSTVLRALSALEKEGYEVKRDKELIGCCYTISQPKEPANQVH